MAIQFACPSCQRPIEIDDEWANTEVACPFCKTVVTAPDRSSWVPAPEAPPVQVADLIEPARPMGANVYGRWSLIMGIIAGVIFVVMLAVLLDTVGPQVAKMADDGATQTQIHEAMAETIKNDPTLMRTMTVGSFILILTSLAGTVLGIVGLTRANLRRGTSIAGLAISGTFLLCQCCPGIAMGLTAHGT